MIREQIPAGHETPNNIGLAQIPWVQDTMKARIAWLLHGKTK